MKNFYKTLLKLLPVFFLLQTAFLQSQTNQYLHFDRVDDFVSLENASQYVTNSDGISMTGWFYCDELAYGQGMMGFRTIGNGFYLIQLNDGVVECRLETGNGLFEFVAPAGSTIPQTWQHWAWIYDGSNVSLYIDGALIGKADASGQLTNANISFGIGKSIIGSYNFVYGGRIDEVSAWNIALSQDDIQDIIDNELTGTEPGLQLYYKFNQGEPGGNNTTITKLTSETGSGERDADLNNFALIGETSNFNGTLNPGFQAISFPQIPNKLISAEPFELEAEASSGLEVFFEVIAGPAQVSGNILTLTGEPGEVSIEATQPGNGQYEPALPVVNSFMVIDPNLHVPEIDARSPLAGDVYVPELLPIQLATFTTIDYPELFMVEEVEFNIDGESIIPVNWGEGYFSAWWEPPAFGNYTINIISTNNFGASATLPVNINIVENTTNIEILAVDDVWLNANTPSVVVDAELPSYLGAFGQITGILSVSCPTGGCGEWDRVASVDARGHDGKWVEIIRYITPYGVPCSHEIDLTDYMSILQGKVSFRLNCETLDNGYLYDLAFNFSQGAPEFNYSKIDIIWQDIYQFGDYANLQPVENQNHTFAPNTEASVLKLVSSGHGWGDLNTGNAAEFHDDTHHIWVNGEQTFEQHNWQICNPNPDGCQPQNGTWYHNRAGWCPGSIAPWFDFNMTQYVAGGSVELGYVFDEDYVDYCHPNHPDCVTGVTCSDCDDGFNPHLVVACNLVSFSDVPFLNTGETQTISINPGFQFVSGRINPVEPDITIVAGEIMNDDLNYIRNSEGAMLRKIGPNWVNGIGNWVGTEGYLIKTSGTGQFTIDGNLISPATPIGISPGFQFVSYLPSYEIDAFDAFSSIVDENLSYVRNSEGAMLRKIGPNWVNGIGNCVPSEGYLVKYTSNAILTYPSTGKKSTKVDRLLCDYFHFDGGNPVDSVFTIYINGLEIGDEVAAFDNENIIGAVKINSTEAFENGLSIFGEIFKGKGFTSGNPITLKIWESSSQTLVPFKSSMADPFGEAYMENVYPSEDALYSVYNITKISKVIENNKVIIFPNPASDKINVQSKLNMNRIVIVNSIGRIMYDRIVNNNMIDINTEGFSKGVYIVKIYGDNEVNNRQVIIE
ncbi:MAG: T9SS type A sorting domain-containing protein [Bacteroidales bacterium]|nr:T9SS type A sorting domain-containing protein [Bacteroidales bacterium]